MAVVRLEGRAVGEGAQGHCHVGSGGQRLWADCQTGPRYQPRGEASGEAGRSTRGRTRPSGPRAGAVGAGREAEQAAAWASWWAAVRTKRRKGTKGGRAVRAETSPRLKEKGREKKIKNFFFYPVGLCSCFNFTEIMSHVMNHA